MDEDVEMSEPVPNFFGEALQPRKRGQVDWNKRGGAAPGSDAVIQRFEGAWSPGESNHMDTSGRECKRYFRSQAARGAGNERYPLRAATGIQGSFRGYQCDVSMGRDGCCSPSARTTG